jgi:hypothetical protein
MLIERTAPEPAPPVVNADDTVDVMGYTFRPLTAEEHMGNFELPVGTRVCWLYEEGTGPDHGTFAFFLSPDRTQIAEWVWVTPGQLKEGEGKAQVKGGEGATPKVVAQAKAYAEELSEKSVPMRMERVWSFVVGRTSADFPDPYKE